MSKNTFFIVAGVVLVIILIILYSAPNPDSTGTTSILRDGTARIEIDFGDGTKRLFEGEVGDSEYALHEALASAALEGQFDIEVNRGTVLKLAGAGNAGGVWSVYLNGKTKGESVDELMIGSGDHYILRFE